MLDVPRKPMVLLIYFFFFWLMGWLQQSSFLILRFLTIEMSENETRTLTVSGDGTGRSEQN